MVEVLTIEIASSSGESVAGGDQNEDAVLIVLGNKIMTLCEFIKEHSKT